MKVMKSILASATGMLLISLSAHAQNTQLTVYTALEPDQLRTYQEGFKKAHP